MSCSLLCIQDILRKFWNIEKMGGKGNNNNDSSQNYKKHLSYQDPVYMYQRSTGRKSVAFNYDTYCE